MNKLIHMVPPSGAARWLGRSLAWTAACLLPCAGCWHWVMVVKDAGCRSCGTTALITPLAVVMLLGLQVFRSQAFAGSAPLFPLAKQADWFTGLAFGWLLVLRLLLAGWLVLDALVVVIMLFSWLDDGQNMWVN